ncbi:MAG: porphobilinogen deaminase, partial [Verrucomicrobiales bacterium]|nr:porphobilinogen deaminase [Verrucomicrobiales bacterium]
MSSNKIIIIASRGSALALAQTNLIRTQCAQLFKNLRFEIKIVKTTGDKLQTVQPDPQEALPKGLFTKEIEDAILNKEADFAVHSLKDLPTELPDGLLLGATPRRQDVRDVLIYRSRQLVETHLASANQQDWVPGSKKMQGFPSHLLMKKLPTGATVGTSSTRREAQLRFA